MYQRNFFIDLEKKVVMFFLCRQNLPVNVASVEEWFETWFVLIVFEAVEFLKRNFAIYVGVQVTEHPPDFTLTADREVTLRFWVLLAVLGIGHNHRKPIEQTISHSWSRSRWTVVHWISRRLRVTRFRWRNCLLHYFVTHQLRVLVFALCVVEILLLLRIYIKSNELVYKWKNKYLRKFKLLFPQ